MYTLYYEHLMHGTGKILEANARQVPNCLLFTHQSACSWSMIHFLSTPELPRKSLHMHMQLGCHTAPASEPSPPPNMAEDPLRHTTRTENVKPSSSAAGLSLFPRCLIMANAIRFFIRLWRPTCGPQTGSSSGAALEADAETAHERAQVPRHH